MLRYPTVTGRPLLIHAAAPAGTELPFGAPVFDGRGNNVGIVSQGGQVYARLSEPNDTLTVKWGHADAWRCTIRVALPPLEQRAAPIGIERIEAPCKLDNPSADAPEVRRAPAGES
ncbi:Outer membrane usher protein HtrE [Burkholderia cepacia]|nr:Outer membrane usher protein HtrE [Burkholderia cepacia]